MKILPLGLAGVFSRMARVRGVTAARRASTSSCQSGSASATSTGFTRSDLSVLHVVAVERLEDAAPRRRD